PKLAERNPHGAEAQREGTVRRDDPVAVVHIVSPTDGPEPALEVQVAAVLPRSLASDHGAGSGETPAETRAMRAGDVETLATANGPWVMLIAVLGSVALYARSKRMARKRAAARRLENQGQPSPGVFRLWGLRLGTKGQLPHGIRAMNLAA